MSKITVTNTDVCWVQTAHKWIQWLRQGRSVLVCLCARARCIFSPTTTVQFSHMTYIIAPNSASCQTSYGLWPVQIGEIIQSIIAIKCRKGLSWWISARIPLHSLHSLSNKHAVTWCMPGQDLCSRHRLPCGEKDMSSQASGEKEEPAGGASLVTSDWLAFTKRPQATPTNTTMAHLLHTSESC